MKTLILFLALSTAALAAEAPKQEPETLREMELRRALIQSQMQVMSLNYNQLQEELKKLDAELAKRKPPVPTK